MDSLNTDINTKKAQGLKKPFNLYKAGLRAVLYSSILTFTGAKLLDYDTVAGVQFGENTTVLGAFNRVVMGMKCGSDCATFSEVEAQKKSTQYKNINDSLSVLQKTEIGQEVIEKARKHDVIFNADQSYFQQSCSAVAAFDTAKGYLHYYQPENVDINEVRLAHILSHELYHGRQTIAAPEVSVPNLRQFNDKELAMIVIVREAAAYATTAMMLHDLYIQKDITTDQYIQNAPYAQTAVDYLTSYNISIKQNGLSAEAAKKKAINDTFIQFFEKQDYLITRLTYMTQIDLSISTFDVDVKDLTMEMLKPLAALPNGQNVIPDGFSIQDLERYIQQDLIAYSKQWRVTRDQAQQSQPSLKGAFEQPTLKEFKKVTCQKRNKTPSI